MLSIMQAAKLAGVSPRCIYKWMHNGTLPYVQTVGGKRRIDRTKLFREPDQAAEVTPPQ